jgi:hypothetical protein
MRSNAYNFQTCATIKDVSSGVPISAQMLKIGIIKLL